MLFKSKNIIIPINLRLEKLRTANFIRVLIL